MHLLKILKAAGNDINTAIGLFLENSQQTTRNTAATDTNADIPPPLVSGTALSYSQTAAAARPNDDGYRAPDRAIQDVLMDASDIHEMYGDLNGAGSGGAITSHGFNVWNQISGNANDDDGDNEENGQGINPL